LYKAHTLLIRHQLPAGYRFTKGLTQNLNLRKHLKLEFNKKIPQLYPTELKISSLVSTLLNYIFYLFDMISSLKVIKKGNDCITLHFA